MNESKPLEATEGSLSSLFGNVRLSNSSWRQLAAGLLGYVYDPERATTIKDYEAISKFLSENWRLYCVEVDSTIQGIGLVKTDGEQLARFSIRMLSMLYSPQYYIALNQTLTRAEKRLALLHELGHMALHYEVLQSLGTMYHRICMDPALEFSLGRLKTLTEELLLHQEKEADLFALTWLLPLGAKQTMSPTRTGNGSLVLTSDGYRVKMRRQLFSNTENSLNGPQQTAAWNALGKETRRRLSLEYPTQGSLVERITWILFNQGLLNDIAGHRRTLMQDYFKIIGPPGRVPELTRTIGSESPAVRNSEYAWIPRIDVDDVLHNVDSDHWEPFLISGENDLAPYYVPVTPVPSRTPKDSELEWANMFKASHAPTQSLAKWLSKAQRERYGLMVFPRTPAEKIMDKRTPR